MNRVHESWCAFDASADKDDCTCDARPNAVMLGWFESAIEARASRDAEAIVAVLREALGETYHHITTYDDAMGHGYCATQSGEIEDACTCGYEAKRERWDTALSDSSSMAQAYRERIEHEERERIKDAIRALPPLRVTNTEYVPQLKRRSEMGRDLAAILLAIDHLPRSK